MLRCKNIIIIISPHAEHSFTDVKETYYHIFFLPESDVFEIQLWEEQSVTKGEDDTTKDKSEMDESDSCLTDERH